MRSALVVRKVEGKRKRKKAPTGGAFAAGMLRKLRG